MRTNTLVVSPTNSRVALFLFSALTSAFRRFCTFSLFGPFFPVCTNHSLAKVSI